MMDTLEQLRKVASSPWRKQARCRDADPDLFFPERGEHSKAAKEVCATCPVIDQCLAEALSTPVEADVGIWGGTNERDRKRIRAAEGIDPGRRPAFFAEHGSEAAYRQHLQDGEDPCGACSEGVRAARSRRGDL